MRLLIYKPSFQRLEASIAAAAQEAGSAIDCVLMDEDGELSLHGRPISLEDAAPDAAWVNDQTFFGPAARAFSRALLKSESLKWLQSGAAGYDHALFVQLVERGVTLSTSHGQAVGMADYVLWGVLDHFQGGPARRAAQGARRWDRMRYRDLDGSRWLVVGFGAIGQGVARRARAFGAHVTGVRRSPAAHADADAMAPLDRLAELLPNADVVVLSVPLSPETRHLADAAFFSAMAPRSVFVNVGRGGLVDEPALLAALDKGVPEHAVLDVFETEPLPTESPFWAHPRVTLTAHASGISEGAAARNDRVFLENLSRHATGEPLANVADPKDVLGG